MVGMCDCLQRYRFTPFHFGFFPKHSSAKHSSNCRRHSSNRFPWEMITFQLLGANRRDVFPSGFVQELGMHRRTDALRDIWTQYPKSLYSTNCSELSAFATDIIFTMVSSFSDLSPMNAYGKNWKDLLRWSQNVPTNHQGVSHASKYQEEWKPSLKQCELFAKR